MDRIFFADGNSNTRHIALHASEEGHLRPSWLLMLLLVVGVVVLPGCSAGQGLLRGSSSSTGKSSANAASQARQPSSPPSATIIQQEFERAGDYLWYTIWLSHIPTGQTVQVLLEGPGAPSAPVYEGTLPSTGDGLVRIEPPGAGRVDSSGWRTSKSRSAVPVETFTAGTYTLVVNLEGKELTRASFEMIEAPTCIGKKELQVSPSNRALRPYLARTGLVMWVPRFVDDGTGAQVFTFQGGKLQPTEPRFDFRRLGLQLAKDEELCSLVSTDPIIVPLPRKAQGSYEQVFVYNRAILGAVTHTAGTDKKHYEPLELKAPSPEAAAEVTRLLDAAAAEEATLIAEGRLSRNRHDERLYCALADKPEQVQQLRRRLGQGGAQTSGDESLSSLKSRAERTLDPKERAALQKEIARRSKMIAGAGKEKDAARRALEKFISRYKPGCRAQLIPAEFKDSTSRLKAN